MAYMHGIQVIEIGGTAAIVAPVDSVAPIITSPLTATTRENTVWSMTLLADENVSFAKRTGADSAAFTLAGATLSLPAQDYEGGKTALVCNLVAMDSAGNVTNFAVTVTVTNVDEIAPLITSAPTATIAASTGYAMTLTANEAVSFEKRSGADGDLFGLAGTTLTLPAQVYNAGKATFTVNLRAIDGAGNPTLFTHVVTIAAPATGPPLIMALAASKGLYPGQTSGGFFTDGVETSETTQAQFRVGPDPIPAGTMRFVYVNSINRPPEVSGANPVRTKAGLRLGNTSATPSLGTSALITVAVDGLGVITPPNQPDVAAQTSIFARSYCEVDAGGKWPLGRPLLNVRSNPGNVANTEFGEGSNRKTFGFNGDQFSGVYKPANPNSDQTGDTIDLTASNSAGFGWCPSAVLGMVPATSKRGLAITDSIGVGSGDKPAFYTDREAGFINHTFTRLAIPYINTGVSSDGTLGWLNDRSRRVAFINLCRPNFVISEIGTNALGAGQTYANLVNGQMIACWVTMKALCGGNMPVYQTALTPRTNATNTAPAYANDATTRQAFNAWCRDGAPLDPATMTAQPIGTAAGATCVRIGHASHPLVGFIDTAIDVEDLSTGLWKIAGYGDGLHPSQEGHAFIAAQAPLMNFNPQIQPYAG